jgi:hypothetical protein
MNGTNMNKLAVRFPSVFLACACVALLGAGCAKRARPPVTARAAPAAPAPQPHGLCFVARDPNAASQPVRAHDWLSLLTKLELGRGGVFATRDCLGRWINYVPAASSCGTTPRAEVEPRRVPVAEETVVVRDLGDTSYLVWVITHRFADDDGFGPLALVRRDNDGLAVEAIGTLRSHTERLKLEGWNIQKELVIAASAESCRRAQSGQRQCERSTQLMLQYGQQLIMASVVDPQGHCLQTGSFELARSHEQPLGGGLTRNFELNADLTHDARYVVVEERLLVRDADPSAAGQPARVVQRLETRRLLQPYAGRLVTRQDSLWRRVVDSAPTTPTRQNTARRGVRPNTADER